tara:strand:+ start:2003 stop:2182 length:180 start_codon:yes stop_codon:yes gene_type:complete
MNTIIQILFIGLAYYFIFNPLFMYIGSISTPLLWIVLIVGFTFFALMDLPPLKKKNKKI